MKKGSPFKAPDFSNASGAFKAANPHLFGGPAASASGPPASPEALAGALGLPEGKTRKIRRSPQPKTRPEVEMAMILARRKRQGEIVDWIFEGMTIEAGDGMRYTPDFAVTKEDGSMLFIEVKGPFIRRTGLQSFQAARAIWSKAEFQLWQLVKGQWNQIS